MADTLSQTRETLNLLLERNRQDALEAAERMDQILAEMQKTLTDYLMGLFPESNHDDE